MLRVLTPEICRRSEYALTPLKCRILSKLLLDNCKFHVITDERLLSKMEGRTDFSRRLKQFDGLTRLTLIPPPYFTTDLHHCRFLLNFGAIQIIYLLT